VPSLLRRFSAPVILNYPYTEADLLHLLANDDDPFNRWEAGQRVAAAIILERAGQPSAAFIDAMRRVLEDPDPMLAGEVLNLPAETFLAEQLEIVDPDALHASRNALRKALASSLEREFRTTYERMWVKGAYSPDAAAIGRRSLRNTALGYLTELGDCATAYRQFEEADNMTDSQAALTALAQIDCPERAKALEQFYTRWSNEPLVVDKWLAVQAGSRLRTTLQTVKGLLRHPAFDIKVPNKVYALVRTFAANHVNFHAADGSGYEFLADQVIAINSFNPQVAARMARGFDRWRKFAPARQAKARAALERILDSDGLTRDVAEIVTKALG
jgi:aminopeptidase N